MQPNTIHLDPGDERVLGVSEVALMPGTGGIFTVRLDDDVLWDRGEQGGFPDLSRLKQLVRDRVAPDRGLGHSDRPVTDERSGHREVP